MSQFMLLLHRTFEEGPKSPDERAAMMAAYAAWIDKLRAEGRHHAGHKLQDEPGKVMRRSGGRVSVTDGPYAEAKEVVGGYFIINAKDYDEACRIAEGCPHLTYFTSGIEVREVHDLSQHMPRL